MGTRGLRVPKECGPYVAQDSTSRKKTHDISFGELEFTVCRTGKDRIGQISFLRLHLGNACLNCILTPFIGGLQSA